MEIYEEVRVLYSLRDDVVGVEAVDIFLGREGLDKDDVGGVVGNHDVLVPTPCSGREAACGVCVELAVMHSFYVEAMDAVVWWQSFTVVARRRCLGYVASPLELDEDICCVSGAQTPSRGSHVATSLHHVALACIV